MNAPARKQLLRDAAHAAGLNALRGKLEAAFSGRKKPVGIEVSGAHPASSAARINIRFPTLVYGTRYKSIRLYVSPGTLELHPRKGVTKKYANTALARARVTRKIVQAVNKYGVP